MCEKGVYGWVNRFNGIVRAQRCDQKAYRLELQGVYISTGKVQRE